MSKRFSAFSAEERPEGSVFLFRISFPRQHLAAQRAFSGLSRPVPAPLPGSRPLYPADCRTIRQPWPAMAVFSRKGCTTGENGCAARSLAQRNGMIFGSCHFCTNCLFPSGPSAGALPCRHAAAPGVSDTPMSFSLTGIPSGRRGGWPSAVSYSRGSRRRPPHNRD